MKANRFHFIIIIIVKRMWYGDNTKKEGNEGNKMIEIRVFVVIIKENSEMKMID